MLKYITYYVSLICSIRATNSLRCCEYRRLLPVVALVNTPTSSVVVVPPDQPAVASLELYSSSPAALRCPSVFMLERAFNKHVWRGSLSLRTPGNPALPCLDKQLRAKKIGVFTGETSPLYHHCGSAVVVSLLYG